jgi:phosphoglycerol transferase MdoB-like AlkP superfamily enzyme
MVKIMTSSDSTNISTAKRFSHIYSFGSKVVIDLWKRFRLPLVSTATIYIICYLISKYVAGLSYDLDAIIRDLILQTILGLILFGLFRKAWAFISFQTLFMGFFLLGHAAKVSFYGVPLSPDDVYAVSDLFWIAANWQRAIMVLFGASLVILLIIGANWRRLTYGLIILTTVGFFMNQKVAALAYTNLVKVYGISVWDMRGNLINHGATLHSLLETLRYASEPHTPPSVNEVNKALASLEGMNFNRSWGTNKRYSFDRPRNIHMIMEESFWDATQLTGSKFSRSPFEDNFLSLWERAGRSKCMTPVYGGYTANSEFEALVGFPVDENGVRFERGLRNDIPALPRLLAKRGYTTIVSHPNVAGFWNRTNAYRRLGFQIYWSKNHFDLDDMNADQLSDESLYRQVLKKIDPMLKSGKPLLNYVVTFSGHIPFVLNERRPHIIKTDSKLDVVTNYINNVYYKSKELADYIAAIQERDPDGIIVAFGDHGPFLGPNFAGFRESQLLMNKMSDWTPEMLKTAYTTPLLIIDGRNGPVKTGIIPLYRLPSLLFSLMGIKEKGMLDYTLQPHGFKIRPLPGRQLVLDRHDRPFAFNSDEIDRTPVDVHQWMLQIATLSKDLFIGRQYSIASPHNFLDRKSLLSHRSNLNENSSNELEPLGKISIN